MNTHFKHTLTVLFTVSCLYLYGQTGKITGLVLDKSTQETLIGVNVSIEGSQSGAISDMDGKFEISDLEAGSYTLIFSYIGYANKNISNVTVAAGQSTTVNVVLDLAENELAEVEVVDFKKTNTEASVLLEMKNSSLVASGISSQQINRSSDRDAAQVVKRIPGVTIQGSFVNIRGLNQRYNSVMLHNVMAPSVETDIKSFAFDIIPSSQLERIIIQKSPSADIISDFAGGLVKIQTKAFPDSNYWSFNYGTTIRSGTTFQDFELQNPGGLFYLGFDNKFGLPKNFPADIRKINDADELQQVGQSLPNNWNTKSTMAFPDQRMGILKGTRFVTDKALIGNVTALNYTVSNLAIDVLRSDYNAYDEIEDKPVPIYNFIDKQYTRNVRLGLLHNWAFKVNAKNSIEFKNLVNFNSIAQYTNRGGQHIESNYFPNNNSFDQVYRGISSHQLLGRHELIKNVATIDWVAGYGFSYRNQPDYRRYRSDLDTSTGTSNIYITTQASPEFLGRFFSELKEHVATGSVAYSHKVGYKKDRKIIPTISVGSYSEYKTRSFKARNIGYIKGNVTTFDNDLRNGGIDNMFQTENINPTTGIMIDEQSNPNDSYTAQNIQSAVFANMDVTFFKKLRIVTGVRYEYNLQKLDSRDQTDNPVVVNNAIHAVLPSINMSYSFTPKVLIRTAYGMSINKPEFREIAPFSFYDFNTNFTNKGNPNLDYCKIHNADLKVEYYPSSTEVINISGFYKRFINPIEVVFLPGAGSNGAKNFTYNNAESADIYGVELEVKKTFNSVDNKFLNRWSVLFNAAYIKSKVKLGDIAVGQSANRPLQGQAPYTVNTGIFYTDTDNRFQVNMMYNVTGKRIVFVGSEDYPDVYEMPRHQLDFNASYTFKKGIELSFNANDLINQETILLQDGNLNGKLERNKDQRLQEFRTGTQYTFGVKYTF
jgi:outer membrane receptor protein involved in Fe transport